MGDLSRYFRDHTHVTKTVKADPMLEFTVEPIYEFQDDGIALIGHKFLLGSLDIADYLSDEQQQMILEKAYG